MRNAFYYLTGPRGNFKRRICLIVLLLVCVCLYFTLGTLHYDNSLFEDRVGVTNHHNLHLHAGITITDDSGYDTRSTHVYAHDNTVHTNTETPQAATNHRYIIQWFNWEQLTMAASNLFSLAWFVDSWKAHVVEPFTCNSRYFGLPHPTQKSYSLFTLLDYNKTNTLLQQHNISHIVKFNDFVQHAKREVIVIHILYDGFDLTRFGSRKQVSRKELVSLFEREDRHYVDCNKTLYMEKITNLLSQWISPISHHKPFRISRYCCVNGSHATFSQEMAVRCGIPSHGSTTVIFTDWKGLSYKKNFRVFVPEAKDADMPHPSRDVYPYSLEVLRNVSAFLSSLIDGREFVGIHLRTEKLGPRNGKGKSHFIRCLKTLSSIDFSNYSNLSVLYFSDLGPFGTKSCMHNCLSKKFMFSSLNDYKIQLSQYSPTHFGGIVDSGFVATVEQESLSRAKVLILVGGGSFQSQVETRYKYYRGHKRHFIYHVCNY